MSEMIMATMVAATIKRFATFRAFITMRLCMIRSDMVTGLTAKCCCGFTDVTSIAGSVFTGTIVSY